MDGEWPKDFCISFMVPLEKKNNAVRCQGHRTISPISHMSKVLLKILSTRIETKARDWIGEDQFGFKRGCGTREAITVLRFISERCLEFKQELFLRFVDFENASGVF